MRQCMKNYYCNLLANSIVRCHHKLYQKWSLKSVPFFDPGKYYSCKKTWNSWERTTSSKKETAIDIFQLASKGYSRWAIARPFEIHRVIVKKYLEDQDQAGTDHLQQHWLSMLAPYISRLTLAVRGSVSHCEMDLWLIRFSEQFWDSKTQVTGFEDDLQCLAYTQFATEPAEDTQVDFGQFQVTTPAGELLPYDLFVMIFGYTGTCMRRWSPTETCPCSWSVTQHRLRQKKCGFATGWGRCLRPGAKITGSWRCAIPTLARNESRVQSQAGADAPDAPLCLSRRRRAFTWAGNRLNGRKKRWNSGVLWEENGKIEPLEGSRTKLKINQRTLYIPW